MINLTSSTHELRIRLGSVPTGSPPDECECVINYRATADVSYEFGSATSFSDNINSKTLLFGSSASSTVRVIDDIHIYNPSAGALVVSIIFYDGSAEWILVTQTLQQYETLTYNDKWGWGKI